MTTTAFTDTIIANIEAVRVDYKNPCKSYATKQAAEKATAAMSQRVATYLDKHNSAEARPANYLVAFNEAWGRWVGGIDLTGLLRRDTSTGGHLGFCTGFFTY